jgi:hypothetical protein
MPDKPENTFPRSNTLAYLATAVMTKMLIRSVACTVNKLRLETEVYTGHQCYKHILMIVSDDRK